MNAILRSKFSFFAVGVVVGFFGLWGALTLGAGSQIGLVQARALPAAVLVAETAATTTSGPDYSGANTLFWNGNTDSSLENYQLERDACCPGERAK